MTVAVRPMRPEDARTYLDIHSRAIRGLAAGHYPPDVIDAWAFPVSDTTVAGFLRNDAGEIRLIAELDGTPSGLGALVVANRMLLACYVVPEAARKGVGSALVTEIERLAREHQLTELELFSSLNAQPFYTSLGYRALERCEHTLRSGLRMAAVKMIKTLT